MKQKKLSQHQQIFYELLQNKKTNSLQFIPIWKFIKEFFIKELDTYGFISYEASARLSELYKTILGNRILQRKKITGKSGACYYAYRLNPYFSKDQLEKMIPKQFIEILNLE